MKRINITIAETGITIYEKHEFYKIIQQNWVMWTILHHQHFNTDKGVIKIQCQGIKDPNGTHLLHLWSTGDKATGYNFWKQYWDHEVAPYCRAWIDEMDHRQRDCSITPDGLDDKIDFSLSRKGPEVGNTEEFLLTTLSISTPQLSLSIIDIPRRELRRLAEFLTNYADELDSDEYTLRAN